MRVKQNKLATAISLLAILATVGCGDETVSSAGGDTASVVTSDPLKVRGGAIEYSERPKSGARNSDRYIPAQAKAARRARQGVYTTALWAFDEAAGHYPSHALDDTSENDLVMALGLGAQILPGKFGNALTFKPLPGFEIPPAPEKPEIFGFVQLSTTEGRSVEPLSWHNADFAALMTDGEDHLRKETGFTNPTDTDLNLGDFDWTTEFWYTANGETMENDGVVFEIGTGPRGENNKVTRLSLKAGGSGFVLVNQPSGTELDIATDAAAVMSGDWHHFSFVYDAAANQLTHYVDGVPQALPVTAELAELERGDESYFTLGKNALWQSGLEGALDEVRFSAGQRYTAAFEAPGSIAEQFEPPVLVKGPVPLFDDVDSGEPLALGDRKHLFIDGRILEDTGEASFVVNPPRRAERVLDNIEGDFRKHLSVVEGEDGLIRIYNSVEEDFLVVYTSKDGVNFDKPDVGHGVFHGHRNVVIPEAVGGLGNVFIDPHAPESERWKFFSDAYRRGVYLYTSPDGYNWKRVRTAALPFKSGTQTAVFYDDQRQRYIGYHRTGIFHTPAGDTQRSSVRTEHEDLRLPVPYKALSVEEQQAMQANLPLRDPLPQFLDNGPLTPGSFGLEFPHSFDPEPMDPVGVDFYLTKAQKYEWAPDTFLAFPIAYFHYENDGPKTRQVLGYEERGRGSGPLETQVSVSRDGIDWMRAPRPAYVGIGEHEGRDVKTAYLGHGMVRRGDEIWQYYFGETQYHSAHIKDPEGRGVYRLVQRLDGFVSLDSPYEKEITVVTKPLVFDGDRLQLNIDTDATGYAQVGFLDENGQPIEGFSVDDSVYINGDFIRGDVEWLGRGKDVSALAGKKVQLVFRMRGSKLYAMQFVNSDMTVASAK